MNVRKKRQIILPDSPIFLILLILPFLKPASLEFIHKDIEFFWNISRVLSAIFIFLIYILSSHFSKFILSISTFRIILLISTLVNSGDYWSFFVTCIEEISFCMLIELCATTNFIKFSKSFLISLGLLCTINLITVFLFPNGMYISRYTHNWFLGYDNGHILYILPFLIVYSLTYIINNNKITLNSFLTIAMFSLSIYITWSVTSVIGISLFIFYIVFRHKLIFDRLLNIRMYIYSNVVIFFGIIIFRIQNIFAFIIENILKKDLTFTGRTRIWDNGLYWFQKRPFIGNGVQNTLVNYSRLSAVHCHNYYLQVLYQSGLIGFLGFSILLLLVAHQINSIPPNKYTRFISFSIFCFLLMLQIEAYTYMTTFFGLLTIAYHIKTIISQLEQEQIKRRTRVKYFKFTQS